MRFYRVIGIFIYFIGVSVFFIRAGAVDLDRKSINSQHKKIDEYYQAGLKAKYNADKKEAVKLFQKAAELGSIAANWQLASMYYNGIDVRKDLDKAAHYYKKVIKRDVALGTNEEFYVSDALLKLGKYFHYSKNPDYKQARYYYFQSATNFVNPEAQFQLGLLTLNGLGAPKNKNSAIYWFQLSAKKGNVAAQAMLGDQIFKAGDIAYGLALIMDAYERANHSDKIWIKKLQDKALSFVTEDDWKLALDMKRQLKDKKTIKAPY